MSDELTLAEVVDSPDFDLILREFAALRSAYRRELTKLDPMDPELTKKALVASAKMRAISDLARAIYEKAVGDGVSGEANLDRLEGLGVP
jgi:hypothetical protein